MMSPDELAATIVRDGVAMACAVGWYRHEADRETGGARELFFDLASVTKPMTALAIARSGMDRGVPLGSLVAEARGTPSEDVPLELFLAHRAGLEAHRPLYAPLLRGEAVDVSAALREAASARRAGLAGLTGPGDLPEEGFAPVYSDLGYVLAGVALARATGVRDAGEAIERLVLEPLGLAMSAGTVRGLAERGVVGPFAPTEVVDWRGGAIIGAVHDENAWALTGTGGSGHAGIFGRVDAVLSFGAAVLAELPSIDWMVRERAGGTLRAGFDGKSAPPEPSSAGDSMGPRAFGHLGFTGTSVWIDPDARVVVTLLTNRVCPTREHIAVRTVRPWAHDMLFRMAVGARNVP
jgi:CubicO group peptidase (beta-lactamase class C family)